MKALWYAVLVIGTFCFMEWFAWFLHKYVMHGLGWVLHEDHHRPTKTRFEKNDAYSLFFAVIAFSAMLVGALNGYNGWFFLGLGVTAYGIGYFLFHDVMFHKRIKWLRIRAKSPYMKRIVHAHAVHHQQSSAHQGVSFGFLYASKEYAVQ